MGVLRTGFKYRVKYVEKMDTKAGLITKFQISIKEGEQWYNVRCTVFKDVPLHDGDEVKITKLDSFELREYNGKIYYNAVVEIQNLGSDDAPFDV